eukprot:TRINITY_DN959_c0_g7_i1.p1 TRINITY_DN959_c0_g7~~TRINITY_DN959_c0_g7_i1.p1  ORF type:complete len:268 (-),score=72.99 TRINITY_DN959_c0_g7_i1:119-922(-)
MNAMKAFTILEQENFENNEAYGVSGPSLFAFFEPTEAHFTENPSGHQVSTNEGNSSSVSNGEMSEEFDSLEKVKDIFENFELYSDLTQHQEEIIEEKLSEEPMRPSQITKPKVKAKAHTKNALKNHFKNVIIFAKRTKSAKLLKIICQQNGIKLEDFMDFLDCANNLKLFSFDSVRCLWNGVKIIVERSKYFENTTFNLKEGDQERFAKAFHSFVSIYFKRFIPARGYTGKIKDRDVMVASAQHLHKGVRGKNEFNTNKLLGTQFQK